MDKDTALHLALEAMKVSNSAWKSLADSGDAGFWKAEKQGYYQLNEQAIKAVEAALEAKDESYAFEVSMYSNDRVKIDPVTGNVSIGTVKKPCGLECDCTDVCKQEAKDEPVACRACNGSGRMVRDPDIGTDQECFVCEGSRVFEDTTPPQRKPLTDEEVLRLLSKIDECAVRLPRGLREFARAIEAAHGIKGEA